MPTEKLVKLIANTYHQFNGEVLPGLEGKTDLYSEMDKLPYPVLSHSNETDPIFTYGNKKTLEIFEYSFDEFTALPSRMSAEAGLRQERARIMEEVKQKGFTNSYKGVRISKTGKGFEITDAAIWNIFDEAGEYVGQAAAIFKWQ